MANIKSAFQARLSHNKNLRNLLKHIRLLFMVGFVFLSLLIAPNAFAKYMHGRMGNGPGCSIQPSDLIYGSGFDAAQAAGLECEAQFTSNPSVSLVSVSKYYDNGDSELWRFTFRIKFDDREPYLNTSGNVALLYVGEYYLSYDKRNCENDPLCGPDCNRVGNPISLVIGNKYQIETDSPGQLYQSLKFERYYNSHTNASSNMGAKWSHNYQAGLETVSYSVFQEHTALTTESDKYATKSSACTSGWLDVRGSISGLPSGIITPIYANHQCRLYVGSEFWRTIDIYNNDASIVTEPTIVVQKIIRPNGKVFIFYSDGAGGWLNSYSGNRATLTNTLTGFIFTDKNDVIEEYNTQGNLVSVTNKKGDKIIYTYLDGKLDKVESDTGESLQFSYGPQNLLSDLTDHTGRIWTYRYDATGNLEYVDNPDSTTRRYHYENPSFLHALTGITDERNIRYATYEYDPDGRASVSTHADNANKVQINYVDDKTRIITNSRGIQSTYTLTHREGISLISNVIGPGCSNCGNGDANYDYYPNSVNLLRKTENGFQTAYGNYDPKGNLGFKTEAAGTPEARTTTYTYDPRFYSKVDTKTEPSVYATGNKVTSYGYDVFGNTTSITINGFTSEGAPVIRATTMQYNGPLNQLSQIDGPRTDVSDITTLAYYANDPAEGSNRGRLKTVTGPTGIVSRDNIQYSATGKVLSENRPNGLIMTNTYYPGNDRLETTTQTAGGENRTTRWTYLPTGEVETITQADGTADATTLTFGYDAARRMTRITDGLGNYIEYVIDTEGNKTGENYYDKLGTLKKALNQTFDLYNRLDTTSQANQTTDFDFAADGSLDKQTDGKGTVTDYSYDALKRLTSTAQDVGGIDTRTADTLTQYGYDVHGNLTAINDPNNNATTYVYDDLGNLLSQTSPDTGTTTYRYDPAGNVLNKLDANGHTRTYTYDNLNRLTTVSDNSTTTETYIYDSCTNGMARLCAIEDNSGTTHYSYSGFGEINRKAQTINAPNSGASLSLTNGYLYNAARQIETINYPSGLTVHYRYINNQISEIILNGQPLLSNITYQPFGPVTGWIWSNGTQHSRNYDLGSQLIEQTMGTAQRSLNYDQVGNIIDIVDPITNLHLGYDALSRLTAANDANYEQQFSYDANSNRTQWINNTVSSDYAYTINSNRLSQITTDIQRDYQLDANGNTLNDGNHRYQYDTRNRLIAVDNGDTGTYSYNALGQRVYKESIAFTQLGDANGDGVIDQNDLKLINNGNKTTRNEICTDANKQAKGKGVNCIATQIGGFKNNASDQNKAKLTAAEQQSGIRILYFSYDESGQLLGEYENTSEAIQETVYLGNMPIATVRNGNTYYIHTDHLGTPRIVTDTSDTEVWRWDSDPFGVTAANDDPDEDGVAFEMNLRFTGQYYDSETGLHYNYFRYYDPQTGRYITSDPIGKLGLLNGAVNRITKDITQLPDIVAVDQSQLDVSQLIQSVGINTYAYVYGNPLKYYDLLGLDKYDWCKGKPGCKPTTDWACSKVPGYCCHVERDQCINNAQTNGCLDEGKVVKCQINYGKCMMKKR